jgi:hypothetical protein
MLVQSSRECSPPYLSTGISNLLQPAQAEVVLGQLSRYLASWLTTTTGGNAEKERREAVIEFDITRSTGRTLCKLKTKF